MTLGMLCLLFQTICLQNAGIINRCIMLKIIPAQLPHPYYPTHPVGVLLILAMPVKSTI